MSKQMKMNSKLSGVSENFQLKKIVVGVLIGLYAISMFLFLVIPEFVLEIIMEQARHKCCLVPKYLSEEEFKELVKTLMPFVAIFGLVICSILFYGIILKNNYPLSVLYAILWAFSTIGSIFNAFNSWQLFFEAILSIVATWVAVLYAQDLRNIERAEQ